MLAELNNEEMAMTDATPRFVSQISISRVAAIMAAITLIFLGIAFQWGQVGDGQFNVDGLWIIHMIATNIWDLIVVHLTVPGLAGILRFWPLLLVLFGFAILLALGLDKRMSENGAIRKGETPSA
jgi:Sec-independent protein secretion pathway component TatC